MKRIKLLLIAVFGIFAFSMPVQAQSCADLFKSANRSMKNGHYQDAILYFQRAMDCDPNLIKDCKHGIKVCREKIADMDRLVLKDSESKNDITEIVIPYQGGDKMVDVSANKKWKIEGVNSWCRTETEDSKNFVVQCRQPNNSIRAKETTLTIKSGSLFKTLRVIQEARPEYLDVAATQLAFPADGTEQSVAIESNANWDVTSIPSWCQVEKSESGIKIIVNPNDKVWERKDEIIVMSPSQTIKITIRQGAGDEHLTLSQNNINMASIGDVVYLKVYTDAENWFVGDFPNWMNVQRIGKDSIRIECGENRPNGERRSGSVQIQTDRQKAGVMVTQHERMPQDLIFPDNRIVSGRNFSLGLSASYLLPNISTSAGGEYVGSVVDYSLGNRKENASYSDAKGFSIGAFADIRLYKNIFLTAGVNFTQYKYSNTFENTVEYIMPYTGYNYMKGDVYVKAKEEYTQTMLEVPILASYRFKLNDVSHVQLNLGPVLNFGMKSKMNLSGTEDSDQMRLYNNITQQPENNSTYHHHIAVNSEMNMYQSCVLWTERYTTGNIADVPHHDKFQDSPFHRFNCGLRLGAAYEFAGISFALNYNFMLSNMANKNYWENKRWTILNESKTTMSGYKHRIHNLEFRIAYTLRYLNLKK